MTDTQILDYVDELFKDSVWLTGIDDPLLSPVKKQYADAYKVKYFTKKRRIYKWLMSN